MMSDELNQISIQLNDEQVLNDSFSDSSVYESVYEPYETSTKSITRNYNSSTIQNQKIDENRYSVYNNNHLNRKWIDWLKLHWRKISGCFLLSAIIISVAVGLESFLSEGTENYTTTVNPSFTMTTPGILTNGTLADESPSTTSPSTTNVDTGITHSIEVTDTTLPTEETRPTQTTPNQTEPIQTRPNQTRPSQTQPIQITEEPIQKPESKPSVQRPLEEWGAWTECSQTCGNGLKERTLVCEAKFCSQIRQETTPCNIRGCK